MTNAHPPAHGTYARALQHRKEGTPVCDPCKAAQADYMRSYRATRSITSDPETARAALDRAVTEIARTYATAEAVLRKARKLHPDIDVPPMPELPAALRPEVYGLFPSAPTAPQPAPAAEEPKVSFVQMATEQFFEEHPEALPAVPEGDETPPESLTSVLRERLSSED